MHAHLLVGLLLAVDAPLPSAEVTTDLEGTSWLVEHLVVGGEVEVPRNAEPFTVRGGKVCWESPASYEVGPHGAVRTLDIEGPGVHYQGIYKVDGGRLTLCLCMDRDSPRPTRFSAEAGEPFTLVVLKRAKK